jgi:RNA polymerase sigma-70 factor (sigma-E family)
MWSHVSTVKSWEADYAAYVQVRAPALRNLAYLICGDWHRAEDHAQTALTKLYQAWRRIDHEESIDAYARTTLVRTVLAEGRRPWRREYPAAELVEVPVPALADAVPERLALTAALAALPRRQRAAVALRYWSDLSVAETARLLGVTEGTVKTSCARGLAAMRAALTETNTEGVR